MACGSGHTRLGALAPDQEQWTGTRRADTPCAACKYGEHCRKLTAPPSERSRRHTAPLTPALLRRRPALQLETLETPVFGPPGPAQVEGHARGWCAPPCLRSLWATPSHPTGGLPELAAATCSPTPVPASVCPHRGWRWGTPTPPPPPSVCPSNLSMATELASRRQLRDRAPMPDGPCCEARGAWLGSAARKLTGNPATSILLKVFSKGSVHCTGSLEP